MHTSSPVCHAAESEARTRALSVLRHLGAPLLWRTPGAFALTHALGRDYGLRCVLFHHIEDEPSVFTRGLDVSLSVDRFERTIKFLAENYDPVDLATVRCAIDGGTLPRRPVLVTFDDAYRSVATHAAEICERHGIPAVFFLNGGLIGNRVLCSDNLICWVANSHGLDALNAARRAVTGETRSAFTTPGEIIADFLPSLPPDEIERFLAHACARLDVDPAALAAEARLYLDRDELRGLLARGFEPANHTLTHARCRALTAQGVSSQITENQALLRELTGREIRAFSVPYGSTRDLSFDVRRCLEATGQEMVFVVEGLPNRRRLDATRIDRVSLKGRGAAEAFWDIELLPRLRRYRNVLRGT